MHGSHKTLDAMERYGKKGSCMQRGKRRKKKKNSHDEILTIERNIFFFQRQSIPIRKGTGLTSRSLFPVGKG
jgi:hypothetical protein